jgi:polyhydroxyalkanoate synthesis repressor PhaR
MDKTETFGERTIKRYDNRKLYDSQERRYVTLEDLGRLIGGGTELTVVDQKSGEDITTVVMAQVLLEGLKDKSASIPRQVLARLIRFGWSAPPQEHPHAPEHRAREEAERIVSGLIGRGRLTLEEALALRREISATVHKVVSETQRNIEGRLRGLLERSEDGVNPALQSLKERLLSFETYLEEPRSKSRPTGRRASKRAPENGKD